MSWLGNQGFIAVQGAGGGGDLINSGDFWEALKLILAYLFMLHNL